MPARAPAPKSLYPRAPESKQSELLRAVVERVKGATKEFTPQVVFDLDGTLLDNRPRSCAIMRELSRVWEAKHPREAQMLLEADPDKLEYLFEENLQMLGIDDPALIEEGMAFWKARFFTDQFLCHDTAIAGSRDFARAVYDAGATLVYFTGRDLPNMALGSLASLRDHGFPIGVPGTEFVLKPNPEMSDLEFKRTVTPRMLRSGRMVAGFDNEPGNCNIFKELFPEASVFMLDTQHLPGGPPLSTDVHVIADFNYDP